MGDLWVRGETRRGASMVRAGAITEVGVHDGQHGRTGWSVVVTTTAGSNGSWDPERGGEVMPDLVTLARGLGRATASALEAPQAIARALTRYQHADGALSVEVDDQGAVQVRFEAFPVEGPAR